MVRYSEVNSGALLDRLESLRTGPAVGITVVLAMDRTGFTHRISSAVASRLVLRQSISDDMAFFGVAGRAGVHAAGPGHLDRHGRGSAGLPHWAVMPPEAASWPICAGWGRTEATVGWPD